MSSRIEGFEFASELDFPGIATGTFIPPKIARSIARKEAEEERAKEEKKYREQLEADRRKWEREQQDRQNKWESKMQKAQFVHDWKIAIFSGFLGAFLSQPLWGCIHAVISALSRSTPG